jgi:hypothetical protein
MGGWAGLGATSGLLRSFFRLWNDTLARSMASEPCHRAEGHGPSVIRDGLPVGEDGMVEEFNVFVTCPDEDEDGNEPVEAVLRVMDRMLAISRCFQHKRGGFWLTWKYRLFRGPWPLQLALTPLFAFNGILFMKRDVLWMGTDTNQHRLRITPLVPAVFKVDIHFKTSEEADAVADVIGQWWLPPTPRYGGLGRLIHRWPEAFAAPLFMVPMAIGFATHDLTWAGVGCAAFAAFVVVGIALLADNIPRSSGFGRAANHPTRLTNRASASFGLEPPLFPGVFRRPRSAI